MLCGCVCSSLEYVRYYFLQRYSKFLKCPLPKNKCTMHNSQYTIIRFLGEQPVLRLRVGAAPGSGTVCRGVCDRVGRDPGRVALLWVARGGHHAKGMALREDSCIYIIEPYVFRNAACPQVAFFQISIYGRQRSKKRGRAGLRSGV